MADDLSRRALLKAAIIAGLAPVGAGLNAARASAEDEPLVTDIPANSVIITSLEYVNQSPNPEQICANCVLYQGPAEGSGKCGLFREGRVPAQAWCKSWVAKG
ncbi:MAG: high-potential iron-sulfur protein [Myxococcota bacterium]|nr:high-potential iron-sulfur protein [Myxococcota bacterium]